MTFIVAGSMLLLALVASIVLEDILGEIGRLRSCSMEGETRHFCGLISMALTIFSPVWSYVFVSLTIAAVADFFSEGLGHGYGC